MLLVVGEFLVLADVAVAGVVTASVNGVETAFLLVKSKFVVPVATR